jgi:hypothetical protein
MNDIGGETIDTLLYRMQCARRERHLGSRREIRPQRLVRLGDELDVMVGLQQLDLLLHVPVLSSG